MTKLDKATNQNCKFEGWWCFFVTLRKHLAENANKSYHVYKVTVVLHTYNKGLGVILAGHPATKIRIWPLDYFEEYILHPKHRDLR